MLQAQERISDVTEQMVFFSVLAGAEGDAEHRTCWAARARSLSGDERSGFTGATGVYFVDRVLQALPRMFNRQWAGGAGGRELRQYIGGWKRSDGADVW